MEIGLLGSAELDRLRPLWLELHAHHQQIAPELAPYVDDDASWAARRALYEKTLVKGGFALVVSEGGSDLGYAVVGEEPAHWPASLVTESRGFEVHTLLVREEERGRGAGTMLLDAVEARLAEEVADRYIGVIPGNRRAAALYLRRGLVPTLLVLTRFGRPDHAAGVVVDPEVETVAAGEVDGLERLWLALHAHHQEVAPHLGPFVDDATSWERMRTQLATIAETGRIIRIGPAEAPIGIAAFHVTHDNPLWVDTWQTARATAELEVIVVDPDARGQGVGTRLLDSVDAILAADGVHDQCVAAFAPNLAAIELYRRRGFRPAWLTLVGFRQPRGA